MLMLDQAVFCSERLKEVGEDYHDAYYYKGKIISAKYYLHNVTPQVWAIADQIKCADTSVLDVPIEFF
jgi:hypothetical protein